jgi:hypothetical protein
MRKIVALTLLLALIILTGVAYAEEMKMIGTVSKIEMAADKKTATVILKDVKSGADVTIVVNDELTLDKFNDKRIVDGDEIRCKYDNENGKNMSKIFKKTAGC